MRKVLTIARFTYLEAISNKVLHSVLLFVALLIGASALYGQVSVADTTHVIKDAGLFGITLFGAITAAITGVSLFNKDIKQKTIYNILAKPVSRTEYITGKYFGFCLTVWTLQVLMGVILTATTFFYSGKIEWELLIGVYGCMLEAAVISAVVIMFSAFALTPVLPGLFTTAVFLAGHSTEFILKFGTDHLADGTQLALYKTFLTAIPNLSLFNWNSLIVYNELISFQAVGVASAYAIVYSALVVIISTALFARRELV